MKNSKNILYFYSNLNGKANRFEFTIYLFVEIIATLFVIDLYKKMNFNNETVINLFYIWIILNFFFIPIQAVTTRRLRDVDINRGLVILNFIPIINVFFKIFLLFKKGTNPSQANLHHITFKSSNIKNSSVFEN